MNAGNQTPAAFSFSLSQVSEKPSVTIFTHSPVRTDEVIMQPLSFLQTALLFLVSSDVIDAPRTRCPVALNMIDSTAPQRIDDAAVNETLKMGFSPQVCSTGSGGGDL